MVLEGYTYDDGTGVRYDEGKDEGEGKRELDG